MNHRAGLDRSQTLLFPERLEDYIAAENPVRFLDAFVASLDLHALGFAKAQCERNVEVLWLLGKLAPDFKTIADFRKDNLQPLKAVARQFTLLCRKLELFGGELLAIDGSKFAAVNARDQNFNADKVRFLITLADAGLAEFLQH